MTLDEFNRRYPVGKDPDCWDAPGWRVKVNRPDYLVVSTIPVWDGRRVVISRESREELTLLVAVKHKRTGWAVWAPCPAFDVLICLDEGKQVWFQSDGVLAPDAARAYQQVAGPLTGETRIEHMVTIEDDRQAAACFDGVLTVEKVAGGIVTELDIDDWSLTGREHGFGILADDGEPATVRRMLDQVLGEFKS